MFASVEDVALVFRVLTSHHSQEAQDYLIDFICGAINERDQEIARLREELLAKDKS